MLTKVEDLKQGDCFAYKGNYFIMDEENCIIKLTGKNSGLACYISSVYGKRQINRKRVKVLNLEIGEI